jgi:hypothetical protein
MDNIKIEFNEVDYIVPAETFSIDYSYLSKQGLPFTKEFIIRALYIAPLSKLELATFFGFNARELSVALEEPINKGEITYLEDGKLSLTALAKGYFATLDAKPMIEKPQTRNSSVTFELVGFNKVPNQHGSWNSALRLDVNHEIQSLSEQHAMKMFKKHFQRLVEAGDLGKINTHDGALPSLYTVDNVTRKKTIAHRVKRKFEIDFDSRVMPFYVDKLYENDEAISNSILQATDNHRLEHNLDEIKLAWDAFQDMSVSRFVKQDAIDFRGMIAEMGSGFTNKPYELLIGPLYGNRVLSKVEQILKQLKPTKQQSKPRKMMWIGANTRYWGVSEGFTKTMDSLRNYQSNSKGSNYKLTLFLPTDDHSKSKDQMAKEWKQKMPNLESCEGIRNGLFDGNVEVLLLDNEFAAVCYHMAMPDISPIHVPMGYITRDKSLIKRVSDVVNGFLEGSVAHGKPNLIGTLSN